MVEPAVLMSAVLSAAARGVTAKDANPRDRANARNPVPKFFLGATATVFITESVPSATLYPA